MKEEARDLPIVDVARKLGLQPRKAGREYEVRCPFHDDRHPSLFLNPDKGVWHCHSCQRGGDAIWMYMEVRRVDFAQALRELVGPPAPSTKARKHDPYPTGRTRGPSNRHRGPSSVITAGRQPPPNNP